MSGFGSSGFGVSPFGGSGGLPQQHQQQPPSGLTQPFTFGASSATNQPPSSSSSLLFGGGGGAFGGSSSGLPGTGGGMMSFGTSPNVAAPGTAAAPTFGTASSGTGFSGGGGFAGGSTPSAFAGSSGFGTASSAQGGLSSSFPTSTAAVSTAGSTPFGFAPFAAASTATSSPPFALPFGGGGVHQQPQHQQQPLISNPFGGGTSMAATAAPSVSFGVSSSVIPSSTSFTPFGNSAAAAAAATSGFGSTHANTATTSFPSSGFTANNNFLNNNTSYAGGDDSDMMGSSSSPIPVFEGFGGGGRQMASPVLEDAMEDAAAAAAAANHNYPPFGGGGFGGTSSFATSSNSTTPWPSASIMAPPPAAASTNTIMFGTSRNALTSLSPVLEEDDQDDDEVTIKQSTPFGRGGASEVPSEDQKRLEMLKAKLADKKRRLLEKQQQQVARGGGQATPPRGSSPSFQSSRSTPPPGLAQRNAARFATKATTSNNSNATTTTTTNEQHYSTQVAPTEREDLSAAVSLVGTCPYMCPDEELNRRQRENDIQLLELLHPAIYPSHFHYTIRDTVVKRFRRSAADYKLDVPEWVRPPDVLERVCSYLEEWVMERDRQGPDPRFSQNGTPPSLDVYQFIWDRTRMIRKDFTLQNYVGTGGKCDARAVRCHERIARWHAMCEHQLSHIPEFVKAQSQQNIQELGQAMKTLNQYYDDALKRSSVEVADDYGNETRLDMDRFDHGCAFDVVQGKSPVDYDGTVLDNEPNSSAIARRLVGKHAVKSPNHGIAEPEMRGLYILLTMDNDGGMEVLKYAADLYQRRPAVYHSKPVQLALSIFKAKKEYNYARFFAILRSPETPYLFACIMFKQVELMRKMAFRIISKTYGSRTKDTNEPMYDHFPLKNLAKLLCFETLDEARETCNHYNITVRPMKIRTSSGATSIEEIVFWRHSAFNEPRDEDKGTLIPLPPRKMLRIIEGKLKGATRLAVCRGQAVGDDAFLAGGGRAAGDVHAVAAIPTGVSRVASATTAASASQAFRSDFSDDAPDDEDSEGEAARQEAKFEGLKRVQMELLRKQSEEEAKREKEEEARLRQEEERQRERERAEKEHDRMVQARKELQKREEQERLERIRKQEENERKRVELELEVSKRKAERQKQLEIEKLEDMRKREQEAKERMRQEEEARLRLIEEERKRHEAQKAEQRRRIEEETRQREALQREQEGRRIREDEERLLEQEWTAKTNAALKKLLWGLWQRNYPRRLSIQHSSNEILRCLDVTNPVSPSIGHLWSRRVGPVHSLPTPPDLRRVVEKLLKQGVRTNLAHLVMDALSAEARRSVPCCRKSKMLLTVAIYIPYSRDVRQQTLCELILMWISSRLGMNQVSTASGRLGEVRVAVIDGTNLTESPPLPADVALVVLPPPWSDVSSDTSTAQEAIQSITERVDSSIPTVILSLCQHPSSSSSRLHASDTTTSISDPASALAALFHKSMVVTHDCVAEDVVEEALQSASNVLASAMVDNHQNDIPPSFLVMDRFSVMQLGLKALRGTIARDEHVGKPATRILDHARISLGSLVDVLHEFSLHGCEEMSMDWPSGVFSTDGLVVHDYFDNGVHLPLNWRASLHFENVEPEIVDLCSILSGSFEEVIDYLLFDAPSAEQRESRCLSDHGRYRECLYHAICYREQSIELEDDETCVYLPRHLVGNLIGRAVQRFMNVLDAEKPKIFVKPTGSSMWQAASAFSPFGNTAATTATTTPMTGFAERIDLPPAASPVPPPGAVAHAQEGANGKRLRHPAAESPYVPVDDDDDRRVAKRSRRSDGVGDLSMRPVGEKSVGVLGGASAYSSNKKAASRTTNKKTNSGSTMSKNLKESKAFTRRLKELAKGGTHDMMVGSVPLSILLKNAPDITITDTNYSM